MLPEEWPPLLGMAGKAVLVHSVVQGQRLPCPAVWVVAVSTEELPLPQRMRRALQRVCDDAAVARTTHLPLRTRHAHRVRVGMQAVAVRTRKVSLLVGAAQPMGTLVGLVAGKTKRILQRRRRIAAPPKVQHRLATGAVRQHPAVVLPRRSVARLALQAARRRGRNIHRKWRSRNGWVPVYSGEQLQGRKRFVLVMTAEAAIRPATGVVATRELLHEFLVGISPIGLAAGRSR